MLLPWLQLELLGARPFFCEEQDPRCSTEDGASGFSGDGSSW